MPRSQSFIGNGIVNHNTTLAGIIARGINGVDDRGEPLDTMEENMGPNGGIDNVRGLIETSRYMPTTKKGKRIIILEEVHRTTQQAMEALLRPLENPSNHCMWILATNEPERLKSTIIGRSYPLKVDLPDPDQHRKYLLSVLRKEKILAKDTQKKARIKLVNAVMEAAGNQPRQCLQLLARAVDDLSEYKSVKELLAAPIMQNPHTDLDKASVKIVLGLLLTAKSGNNNIGPILGAIAPQDGYALTQRLIGIVEALLIESTTGVLQPMAWGFKKIAGDRIKDIDVDHLSQIFETIIHARTRVTDFSIAPRPVLIAAISTLYFTFLKAAKRKDK